MNDKLFLLVMLMVFIAIFVAIEGFLVWWNSTRGPEARRLAKRLRMISAGDSVENMEMSLLKRRLSSNSPALERMMLMMPRLRHLDRLLVQSGTDWTLPNYASYSIGLFLTGLFGGLLFGHAFAIALAASIVLGLAPSAYLIRRRNKRLGHFEAMLPEALDLIGRALRAGHSFSSALQMTGSEMPDPIGEEFRQTFDEINFGINTPEALRNLSRRVPSTDLGFFVVAVLIQRETGGNLSEVLANISSIIRERLKLFGKIRALSAEGRLSGLILTLLPFVAAAALYLIDSDFMALLWTDPSGLAFMKAGLVFMAIGALWMRRIVRIHV